MGQVCRAAAHAELLFDLKIFALRDASVRGAVAAAECPLFAQCVLV